MRIAMGLVVMVIACGGSTQGGSDGGTDAVADTGPLVLHSLTDVCDGVASLTGANVTSIMQPYYTATYTPSGGAPTAMELFLTISNNPMIVCHPHVISMGGPPDEAASIVVTIHAQLSTADKAFSESFDATLSLNGAQVDQSLAFIGGVPISAIQGTFTPVIGGTWATHDVSFGGTLSPAVEAGASGGTAGTAVEQASNTNMGQVHGAGSWK